MQKIIVKTDSNFCEPKTIKKVPKCGVFGLNMGSSIKQNLMLHDVLIK